MNQQHSMSPAIGLVATINSILFERADHQDESSQVWLEQIKELINNSPDLKDSNLSTIVYRQEEAGLADWLDIETLTKKYPQFKEGQLRWLVVKRKEKSFSHVIRRVGRRLYFHVPSLLEWVDKQSV